MTNDRTIRETWGKKTYQWISSSIVIIDKCIYFGTFDSIFYKVDLNTGESIWKIKTGGEIYSQPTFYDNKIFFASLDNKLYALDSLGNTLWSLKTENYIKYPILHLNEKLFITIKSGGVLAINANSGKLIWEVHQSSLNLSTTKLSLYNNTLYVGDLDGKICAINSSNGNLVWSIKNQDYFASQIEVGNGIAFLGVSKISDSSDAYILALDCTNGKEKWRKKLSFDTRYKPAFYQNKIYFGTEDKKLYCLNAETGQQIWSHSFDNDAIGTLLLIVNNNLYFGTYERYIYIIDAENGNVKLSQEFNYGICDPISYKSEIYFGTGEGKLYKIVDKFK